MQALGFGLMLLTTSALGVSRAAPAAPSEAGLSYVYEQSWALPAAPSAPLDLALGPEGLYAIDGAHNAVLAFAADGSLRGRWEAPADDEIQVPMTLVADASRQRVQLLWSRYRRETDGSLSFIGVYLDTRGPDGVALRPLRPLPFLGPPVDMALEPESGELFISSEGKIHHVNAESAWQMGSIDVGDTRGAAGQIAVLDSSRLAILRPIESVVRIVTFEGIPVGSLDLGRHSPLSLAPDGAGGVQVLVRALDQNDPGAPVLMRFDAEGKLVASRTQGAMGTPPIANATWPWSLAAGPEGLALSAGADRFHSLWYDRQDRLIRRFVGGRVLDRFEPSEAPPEIRPPISLVAREDGSLLALDGRDTRLVELKRGAAARLIGTAPAGTLDVSQGPEGEIYAATEDGRLLRLPLGDAPTADWERACDCDLGGRVAAGPGAVYVSRPRQASVGTYNPEDGLSLRAYDFPEGAGLWPSDVEIAPDGRLYTADLISAQVQAWQRPDAPDGIWQAGLLAGPRRLATARWEGQIVVAAIMADGFVEIHQAARGQLLARWQPRLPGDRAFDMADLALGEEGEVYIADAGARAVQVFSPGAGIPPTAPAEPSITPTPSSLACTIRGDKWARPSTVVLGATTGLTLTLSAECPVGSRVTGADIVLVIDRSGSMRGQKLLAAAGAARSFAELLDVRYHRLGLVSFSAEARVDVGLTTDLGAILDGLNGLSPEGETNLAEALRAARTELEGSGRPEALPVIILLTDGQFNAATDDPRPVAQEARNWGAQIYTVGLGTDVAGDMLREIAGDPGRYFHAPTPSELYPIYSRILREVLASLAGNLIIDELLNPGLPYLEGSARPAALESDSRLRWGRSLLPASGITMTYLLRADTPGCHPTSLGAFADYTDADGQRRRFPFPAATVCVITPTPTPTATATPTASPTPEPRPIYLPILNGCRPATSPVDIVLLVDSSSSMAGLKMEQARTAATSFVGLLDLRRDQAAVIGFDDQPRLRVGLTGDLAALRGAIAGLSNGSGTRIDRALQAALSELIGPRRKPGNQGVIVLMSDGAHNGPANDLRRAAQEARSLGALIYAIGFGADVDLSQLTEIAGPERTYFAADGAALEAIYRQIAVGIPCR
jgi:Mg-chelatase subunit ChlD